MNYETTIETGATPLTLVRYTQRGQNPLVLGIKEGWTEVVKLLIHKPGDVNRPDNATPVSEV